MATNARMLPPGDGKHTTTKANGRTYTAALGSTVDVPSFDATILAANGWVRAGGQYCDVGPTSARPTVSASGQRLEVGRTYLDTTLSAPITWDGVVWRNSFTGASV